LDDEKNFVNLSNDKSCVRELLRCAVQVKNADFKRITLQIEESSSPPPARSAEKSTVVPWKKKILPANTA